MKRHPITLIEVLVAGLLLGILLSVFLGMYSKGRLLEQKSKQSEEDTLVPHYCYQRLQNVLSKVILKGKKGNYFFYTAHNGTILEFFYDNGIDIEGEFGAHVWAALQVEEDSLWLITRPNPLYFPSSSSTRKEKLVDSIKDLAFTFYSGPVELLPSSLTGTFSSDVLGTVSPEEKTNQWAEAWKTLPAFIEISFKRNSQSFLWKFFVQTTPQKVFTLS